jgi:hypothetical protein
VVGLAEGMAAAVRRRQREREPRVVIYDGAGAPRLVAPSASGYDELLDAAKRMVGEAGGRLVVHPRAGGVEAEDEEEAAP